MRPAPSLRPPLHRRGAWSLRDDAAYLAVVFVLAAIGWSVHAPVIALN